MRKEFKLDFVIMYRLEELKETAAELGLDANRVDEHRLDVHLAPDIVLVFWNMVEENLTLVGFDGTPWHSHDIVQFLTGTNTYEEYDELDILVGLGSGELVVVSQYFQGELNDRWLAHKEDPYPFRYVEPGEELRVLSLDLPIVEKTS